MKVNLRFGALAIVLAASSSVGASTVTMLDTSLAALNGAFGSGTATTSSSAAGTVTMVVGPSGSTNRASANYVADTWVQRNVGGNGTVGITNDYARSGNGSALFSGSGAAGAYKSDLEILFGTAIAASNITGMGFDWRRDSSTTVSSANLHPVLRLMVTGTYSGGAVQGYLVFERDYNGSGAAPLNTWVTESFTNTAGKIWGTGTLPGAFSDYTRDLDDWDALVSNLTVRGLSIGIGSGWNGGDFRGAIDNVTLNTGSNSTTWNFEVQNAAAAVPEPSTLALVGLAMLGLAINRRRGCNTA